MTSNPKYGINTAKREFEKYNLDIQLCFRDSNGKTYGLIERKIAEIFNTADIFVDLACDLWKPQSEEVPVRVLIDLEPGWNQIEIQLMLESEQTFPNYNFYSTHGLNIGTMKSPVPLNGIPWKIMFTPVHLDTSINIKGNMTYGKGQLFVDKGKCFKSCS